VSWFITGEQKTVSNFGWKQPAPRVTFNPMTLQGCGAWEVLFRYTMTDTRDSLFDIYSHEGSTYSILTGADHVDEFTIGLNWTWNPLVRWQLNYVYLDGNNDGIQSGDSSYPAGTKRDDTDSMLGLRMIFKF
jgi:phosphate-selective porin